MAKNFEKLMFGGLHEKHAELIAYVTHIKRTAQKTASPIILHCRGNVFTELLCTQTMRSPLIRQGTVYKITHSTNLRTESNIWSQVQE
jgi:hypothetical protein